MMPKILNKISKKDVFWHLLVTGVLLIIYAPNLASTPNTYDSGVLQFAGKVLGTVHPTGYPTYIILNYLFVNLLPLGTLAWKANFLSAIFIIIALNYLFRLIAYLKIPRFYSAVATIILGATRELWIASVTAEVYSLNLMFFSMVFYYLFRWHEQKQDRYFYLAAAIYAISFGNHLTTLTLLPAFVYITWLTNNKAIRDFKKVTWVVFWITVGALQYSYLLWRYYDSSARFLEGAIPDLKGLFYYVTGAHWKSEMFSLDFAAIVSRRLPHLVNAVIINFYYLPVILIILGILKFKRKGIHPFFFLSIGGVMIFALNYNIPDIKNYYLPIYYVLSIYMARGLHFLADKYSGRTNALRKINFGCLALVLLFGITNFLYLNKQFMPKNRRLAMEVKTALDTVGKNAAIVSPGYNVSPVFWYYLLGEDLEREKNIYLIHHFNRDDIYNYLTRYSPIYLNEQRRFILAHLDVYLFGPDFQSEIQKTGLKTEFIGGRLFRVCRENHSRERGR